MKSSFIYSTAMAAALAICLSPAAKALDKSPELSLEVAKKMAAACEAKSKEQNWKMNISVVDDGANEIFFEKMDGAYLGSRDIALHKAQTSARFPFPTRFVQELAYGKDLKGGALPGIAVVPGDPGTQRRNAERRGVIDPRLVQRGMRGGDGDFGRCRRRLPHFHVNDMTAGRLDARRGRHYVHHHKGWNIAPPRGRQQGFHPVSKCRFQHRYLLLRGRCPNSGSEPVTPQTGRIRWLVIAFSSEVIPGSRRDTRVRANKPWNT